MRDDQNLIVQKNGDGGDTPAREGLFWIAVWIYSYMLRENQILARLGTTASVYRFEEVLSRLEVKPGVWCRHPIQYRVDHEYSFSRDQTVPLLIAMGLRGRTEPIKRMIWAYIKRGFRAQNKTDIMGPNVWGISIRAMRAWYLWPLLLFTDLFMIIGTIIRLVYASLDKDDVGDDINLVTELLQSHLVYPTPFSYIARMIYVKIGPAYGKGSRARYAFEHYFRPETNANPFDELYAVIIWKYLT